MKTTERIVLSKKLRPLSTSELAFVRGGCGGDPQDPPVDNGIGTSPSVSGIGTSPSVPKPQ
jgi:hypothetical protein